MTALAFSTRIRHDSDAFFQEWVQEFHDALVAIGLVQTSDTGQYDIPSLTRPGVGNWASGYEIWRFNDTLQATAPIFLKIEYGTGGGSTTSPNVRIAVGTGTDGAGTLTQTGMSGTLTTSRVLNAGGTGGSQQTSDSAKVSHFCHAEGFLGISWKQVIPISGFFTPGLFAICRTCDNQGQPDARGMLIDWGNNQGAPARQAVRFTASAEAYTVKTTAPDLNLGMMPQAPTSTVVDGSNQVALGWTITPLAEPLFGLCGIYPNEVPAGHTFQATLVGTTPRTYISVQNWTFGSPTSMRVAMLWE